MDAAFDGSIRVVNRYQPSLPDLDPGFVRKLERARTNLRGIAFTSVVGGVFALAFTLFAGIRVGWGVVTLPHLVFLIGGAIAFGIGVGLLNYAEPVRRAGTAAYLVWGVVSLIVGATAAFQGSLPLSIFCMVGGVAMLVFADLMHLPAEIFVCAYAGGDLGPLMIEEGILKGHADTDYPGMARFVSEAQPQQSAVPVEDASA